MCSSDLDMTQNYALGDGDVVYLSDNGQINIASILATAYQLKTTITN